MADVNYFGATVAEIKTAIESWGTLDKTLPLTGGRVEFYVTFKTDIPLSAEFRDNAFVPLDYKHMAMLTGSPIRLWFMNTGKWSVDRKSLVFFLNDDDINLFNNRKLLPKDSTHWKTLQDMDKKWIDAKYGYTGVYDDLDRLTSQTKKEIFLEQVKQAGIRLLEHGICSIHI